MPSLCLPVMLAVITQSPALDTLNGAVHDAAGRPIAGASVFISAAAPRKGIGVLCPSCYPDCRKSAVSDGEGRFVLRALDPELKFRLLVVARGFAPAHTPQHIMPGTGAAVITLKPHDLQHRKLVSAPAAGRRQRRPYVRASVSPDGVRRGNGGQFGALAKLGIDELAVTDDEGEFQLGVGEDGDALYLLINAPMLAPVRTEPLAAGPSVHTITVGPGVTVSGRVVKDGRPLANVAMGMVQTNRNVEGYLGHFEFATDRTSVFSFVNIPPVDQQWYLTTHGQPEGLRIDPDPDREDRWPGIDCRPGRHRGPARLSGVGPSCPVRRQARATRHARAGLAPGGLDSNRHSRRGRQVRRQVRPRIVEPIHESSRLPSFNAERELRLAQSIGPAGHGPRRHRRPAVPARSGLPALPAASSGGLRGVQAAN